jgi:hypothetical protein
MPLVVTCPSCHSQLQAPEELVGKQVRCPQCSTVFVIPPESTNPPATVLEAAPGVWENDAPEPPARWDQVKPGKVEAIAIMTLIGGILAAMIGLSMAGFSAGFCCLWPGTYYSLVLGIMAIVKASALLGQNAHRERLPRTIAIMQIVNIINGDLANCVMGIIALVFTNDEQVRRYFRN